METAKPLVKSLKDTVKNLKQPVHSDESKQIHKVPEKLFDGIVYLTPQEVIVRQSEELAKYLKFASAHFIEFLENDPRSILEIIKTAKKKNKAEIERQKELGKDNISENFYG